jgi:hypothetical protein
MSFLRRKHTRTLPSGRVVPVRETGVRDTRTRLQRRLASAEAEVQRRRESLETEALMDTEHGMASHARYRRPEIAADYARAQRTKVIAALSSPQGMRSRTTDSKARITEPFGKRSSVTNTPSYAISIGGEYVPARSNVREQRIPAQKRRER